MAHRAKWVIHRATHQEDEIQIQEIRFLLGTGFYNYVMMTSSNKIKGTISADFGTKTVNITSGLEFGTNSK